MSEGTKNRVAGILAGLAGGLFGGGGGMVLLPLLTKWGGLEPRKAFATCVAVVLPISVAGAAVHWWQVRPALSVVVPYLLGGAVGGVIGGLTYEKVPVKWLRMLFGLFLLYGGVRYLL